MIDIHLLGTLIAAMAIVNFLCAWMIRRAFRRLFARTDALKQMADITNSNIGVLHSRTSVLDARVTSIEDEFPFRTVDAVRRAKASNVL